MDNILKRLLLITIFLLPLLGANGNFGYEQIKVLFFLLSISLIGLLQIRQQIKWTLISKIAAVFILILWVTSLTGINPQASILGTQPYFQGAILYSYLFLFFLIIRNSNIKLEQWAKILSLSATIVGLLAIKDWLLLNIFHLQIPTYAGRVVSTFGQPNFYAGFLLLTLPFSYLLWKSPNKKMQYLGYSNGLVSAVAILMSYSRSTILILFLLIILAFFDQLKIRFKITIFLLVMILAILVASVFISVNYSSGMAWGELVVPINNKWLIDNSPEKRVFIWPVIITQIFRKPLLGYGLENISAAYSDFFKQINFNTNSIPTYYSLKDLIIDRSHNYILDLWLFSGILGVLVWLGLVIVLIQKYDGPRKNVLLVSLMTYLIWVQFQNQSIVQLVYFWSLVGLIETNT